MAANELAVSIDSTEERTEGGETFVVYRIVYREHTIWRRYSEFAALHKEVRRAHRWPPISALMLLPGSWPRTIRMPCACFTHECPKRLSSIAMPASSKSAAFCSKTTFAMFSSIPSFARPSMSATFSNGKASLKRIIQRPSLYSVRTAPPAVFHLAIPLTVFAGLSQEDVTGIVDMQRQKYTIDQEFDQYLRQVSSTEAELEQ